jgi:ribosomal protein S18 acetylase RimI-like enzyme
MVGTAMRRSARIVPRLRDAEVKDYAAVAKLATALAGFAAPRRRSFAAVLAHPDHDLIVAEVAGEVVGFAHLLTYHDLSHGARAGELLGLIVRDDLRRQRVGGALLRKAIRRAKKRGVREFHINTEAENDAAQRLYVRFGAKLVGIQMELDVRDTTQDGTE